MYHRATNICNGILHKRKSTVPNGKRYCEAFCELAVFLCNKFLNRKYIYVVILNGEKVLDRHSCYCQNMLKGLNFPLNKIVSKYKLSRPYI